MSKRVIIWSIVAGIIAGLVVEWIMGRSRASKE